MNNLKVFFCYRFTWVHRSAQWSPSESRPSMIEGNPSENGQVQIQITSIVYTELHTSVRRSYIVGGRLMDNHDTRGAAIYRLSKMHAPVHVTTSEKLCFIYFIRTQPIQTLDIFRQNLFHQFRPLSFDAVLFLSTILRSHFKQNYRTLP